MSHDMDNDPRLDEMLRRLPYPKAPNALADSVLARLRAERDLVWWRRPMLSWPLAARVLGVGWLLVLALGVAYALGGLPVGAVLGETQANGGDFSAFGLLTLGVQVIASLGSALQACVSAVPVTVWWLVGGTLGIVYLGCLAVGTLIYRRMFPHHS